MYNGDNGNLIQRRNLWRDSVFMETQVSRVKIHRQLSEMPGDGFRERARNQKMAQRGWHCNPTQHMSGTYRRRCSRFTGKFGTIDSTAVTLPRRAIICSRNWSVTWEVASSTTMTKWKSVFLNAREFYRPIPIMTEFVNCLQDQMNAPLCSGIVFKRNDALVE